MLHGFLDVSFGNKKPPQQTTQTDAHLATGGPIRSRKIQRLRHPRKLSLRRGPRLLVNGWSMDDVLEM